ncbi:unnamed protein product [Candida verbasci]|uniref:UEV domain-containing protein n=1 Tax=Candida verbasci TaxID=1227364 RepID=A0A9W4TVH4_9ASCO|nr:unnamed protein product [Candida verbasci]
MSLPQSVSNWLYNVIQPLYIHKQIVYTHIYQFLQLHFKKKLNFKIRTQIHTFIESGQSQLLINLFGIIYIDQIGVPVEIWIPLGYPFDDVPIVYIKPDHAKNWYLIPTNHVDMQGIFYHPYLTKWYKENGDFNLIELINVIHRSILNECPITLGPPVPKTCGPALPPKPIKSPPTSTIPLKYQQPLPIPTISPYPKEISTSPILPKPNTQVANIKEHKPEYKPPDIMDSEIENHPNPQRKELLIQLSNKINEILSQDQINQDINFTNENIKKVDALYNQLNHHCQQAAANSENLETHINYLSTQLTNLTNLNQELTKLDRINQDSDEIHINQTCSLSLDDIIIPDSPLVKQLYEVVCEIKSIKDTIELINQNVNDKNLEYCVKSIRNLGRQLFWLELTKNEIAYIMNLQV